jgi:hypothetical protein
MAVNVLLLFNFSIDVFDFDFVFKEIGFFGIVFFGNVSFNFSCLAFDDFIFNYSNIGKNVP